MRSHVLLAATRIIFEVSFQLLDSAVFTVVWALLLGIFKNKLRVSKTNIPAEEHLEFATVPVLFRCKLRNFFLKKSENLFEVISSFV
jgi:hypothetical protein